MGTKATALTGQHRRRCGADMGGMEPGVLQCRQPAGHAGPHTADAAPVIGRYGSRQQCQAPGGACPAWAVPGEDLCIGHLMEPPRKRHKYHAEPTTVDGIRFDSKFEAEHYAQLALLQKGGQIAHLVLQPEYPLIQNGVVVARIRLDFAYDDLRTTPPSPAIVDVKGTRTRVYRLKKKMFEAQYGVTILEVMRPKRRRANWKRP